MKMHELSCTYDKISEVEKKLILLSGLDNFHLKLPTNQQSL